MGEILYLDNIKALILREGGIFSAFLEKIYILISLKKGFFI